MTKPKMIIFDAGRTLWDYASIAFLIESDIIN